jgi:hypothetical protein
MAYSGSPSSSSPEACAFSHNGAGMVHSMIERTSCAPLPWLLDPGSPLLTPLFAGEICALLWVFSGDYPSEKTPHRLLPGMRRCPWPRMPCESVYALRGDTVCNNQGVAREFCMCAQRETAGCPVLCCPSVTSCSAANLRRAAPAPVENRADCPTTPGPGALRQSPQFSDPSSRSAHPAVAAV